MLGTFSGLSWFGIGIAVIAYYLLGALWFTPLFGKAWDSAVGVERSTDNRFPAAYYVVPLLSAVVVTVATAVLIERLDLEELSQAAGWGATIRLRLCGGFLQ